MMRRQCGDCTLCCRLLPMKKRSVADTIQTAREMVKAGMAVAEDFRGLRADFDKPANTPCPHQSHAKGCKIYAGRPFSCRIWNCRWLTNDDTADLSRPDRARYVIDIMPDFVTLTENGAEFRKVEVIQIWVDPKHPDAWREPAALAYIERRGAEGKATLVRNGPWAGIAVFPPAMAQDNQWHEIPHSETTDDHLGYELFEGLAKAAVARSVRHAD